MKKQITPKNHHHLSLIFTFFFLLSCTNNAKQDFEKAKKELLLLDAAQRKFHFTKNASGLVALFSKNYMFVNQGEIKFPNEKKSIARFKAYFDSVDSFLRWDNIEEPIIRFSDDGSVAYVVVHKMVILKEKNKVQTNTTDYAWLTVYKKLNNEWKIDCVTSTNK
ncbi:MAG TPA: nuclear transport factor 2 family protein [Puia sp.]|nr:nuclear transport factor 2 family protein [Puia sp.]